MMKKNIFILFILTACLAAAFSTSAASDVIPSLKITSVKENVFSGRGVSAQGTALPGGLARVGIYDAADNLIRSLEIIAGETGEWFVNFDQPLRNGKYYIEATATNPGGEWGISARSDIINVRGPFALIIAIFSILVLILTAVFVIGWYLSKRAEIKRYQRILITERDIASSYQIMKKDVQKALQKMSGDKFDEGTMSEVEFLLKKTDDNLEKMHKYITKGINIVSKYDIISKIGKQKNINNSQ